MADSPSIKDQLRSAFRDYQVDEVPSSGPYEPEKRLVREGLDKLADYVAEVGASASAGRRVYATLAARDAWTDRPEGAQAYVEATGLNYRWDGTAWREFTDPVISAADRAETAANQAEDVRTEVGNLIRSDGREEPLITVLDKNGYGFDLVTRRALGAPVEEIWTSAFSIYRMPGVGLAIGDGEYFPVWIPEGERLTGENALWEAITALQSRGSSGASPALSAPAVQVVAHRTVHYGGLAPENSLDGLVLAGRAGFGYVEIDVQLTSDLVPVVLHDDTLNRTCRLASDYSVLPSAVRVDALTAAALRSNYVLAANDPAMRRPVPTLAEFVAQCRVTGQTPLIELKGSMTTAEVDLVIDVAVPVLGWAGCVFISFTHSHLDYIRTVSPLARIAYVTNTVNSTLIARCAANNGILNAAHGALTPALAKEAQLAGVPLAAWTVPVSALPGLLDIGLEWATTDAIAPAQNAKGAIVTSVLGGPDWEGFTTSGSITGGVVSLATGQTLALDGAGRPAPAFGGLYVTIEGTGGITLTAPGMASVAMTLGSGVNPLARAYQALTVAQAASLTVTASSAAKIKQIHITHQRF